MAGHGVWDAGIGGSNPLTSTSSMGARAALSVIARSPMETMRAEHPPLGLKRDSGLFSLQVWLSGRAPRRQRGDRGFESRHLLKCPRSTTVVHRFRKPAARVQFSTGARRACPYSSAVEQAPCKGEVAGSIPAAGSMIFRGSSVVVTPGC